MAPELSSFSKTTSGLYVPGASRTTSPTPTGLITDLSGTPLPADLRIKL